MCTLSWQRNPSQNELYLVFSRDEMRVRVKAEPPKFFSRNGIRYMAPVDPQGEGTWIAANDRGLILCLLNDYMGKSAANYTGESKSRGLLVRKLITLEDGSPEAVRTYMNRQSAASMPYNPFNLVAFSGLREPEMWHWNGESLETIPNPPMPVVSAGREQDKTQRLRAKVFDQLRTQHGGLIPESALLHAHEQAEPKPQPYSIAMELPDKGTMSITKVRLQHTESELRVKMEYLGGSPLYKPYEVIAGLSLTIPKPIGTPL